MIILLPIDSFLIELFSNLENNLDNKELIRHEVEKYYTYENIKPIVIVNDGFIEIQIKTEEILNLQTEFSKALKLCDKGEFNVAIPIIENLIKKNPTNSEYYRNLGQAYSMIGDNDTAINYLIDALKWNPKNNYALLMIGNIFGKFKKDIDTAKKYYDKVIENNPYDHIAITNLGTNYLQNGKLEEGLKCFEQSYTVNKEYPNTILGMGLVNEKLGNTLIAFEFGVQCLKKCTPNDAEIQKHAIDFVLRNAKKYHAENNGERVFLEYKSYVEGLCKKPIRVEVNNEIDTAAKIEFAETYNREFHLIKYKSSYLGVFHLMMHEIAHLHFVIEARNIDSNMQFVSNNQQFNQFKSDFQKYADNLVKSGLPIESGEKFLYSLFHGINLQLFNTPVDLFIEDRLYELYQEIRPIQFLSLIQMLTEGANAVSNKDAVKYTPPKILAVSKILNMVNALHLKALFGLDILSDFKASPTELKQTKDLFQEFFQYRDDKAAGEEYEIIQHWGEDLQLSNYFSITKEPSVSKSKSLEKTIESIENDPFGFDDNKELKQKEMDDFLQSKKETGINMAVVMYMVDALEYFMPLTQKQIKDIAYQIALVGTQGISPDGKGYKIPNIKGKDFSGYHLLAYYYVSFAISAPELLNDLRLPYNSEYSLAKTLFKPKGF